MTVHGEEHLYVGTDNKTDIEALRVYTMTSKIVYTVTGLKISWYKVVL